MSYTVQQIINIASVSEYLCANDLARRGLWGGGVDLGLPRKIYTVKKSVEWLNDLDPTDTTLTGTSNFLYALCAPYNVQAAIISGSTSGGSVSPIEPVPSYSFVSLAYTVDIDGLMTYQTNDLIGGNNLGFIILNDQLLTLSKGEFTVDYTTGIITFTATTLFISDSLTLNFNKKL